MPNHWSFTDLKDLYDILNCCVQTNATVMYAHVFSISSKKATWTKGLKGTY